METASQHAAEAQPRVLPTGTVTFLFSDIEGSTQRWESHRDAMKAAVRKHEELMRLMAALREQLSEAEIAAHTADGAALSEEQAIEEALSV